MTLRRLCALLVVLCLPSRMLGDDRITVDLVIVAGQSNAVGADAKPSDLPADASDRNVLFWWKCGDPPPDEHDSHSNNGWTHLQPQPLGNPITPRRGRQYGNFSQPDGGFGPEIGFAREWQKHSDRKLAIVKTAFSGTGLGRDWDPHSETDSGVCFRAMLTEVDKAILAAKAKGIDLQPKAIIWVQGESDANAKDAPLYEKRLGEMLSVLRKHLETPELTALIAVNTKFSNGRNMHMPTIVEAQQSYAESDPHAIYVDTADATIANSAHYDTPGTLLVGTRFAESLAADASSQN